jgi:hypothetical protein
MNNEQELTLEDLIGFVGDDARPVGYSPQLIISLEDWDRIFEILSPEESREKYGIRFLHDHIKVDPGMMILCESCDLDYDRIMRTFTLGDPMPWRDKPEPAPVKFEVGMGVVCRARTANDRTYHWIEEGRTYRVLDIDNRGHIQIQKKGGSRSEAYYEPEMFTPAPEPEQAEKGIAEMISEGFHGRITGMTPYEPPTEYEYHLSCHIIWPDGREYRSPEPVGVGWEKWDWNQGEAKSVEVTSDETAAAIQEAYQTEGDVAREDYYRRPVQPPERYEVNSAVEFLGGA